MFGDDRPVMTDEEFAVALAELTALGLVEWQGDEDVGLNNKGINRALELRDELGGTSWVLLTLFMERINSLVSEEE